VKKLLQPLSLYSRFMLIAIALLSVIVVIEVLLLGAGPQAAPADNGAATALPGDVTSIDSVTFPSLPSYRQLQTRPLFTDTRKPPPRPAQAAQGIDLGKKWKLTGIIVAGDDSHVFMQGIRDKKVQRLETGAVLDGWELSEIAPGYVMFRSGARETTLELRKDADKP